MRITLFLFSMQTSNLLAGIPTALPDELVDVILTNPHLRLERIVSKGHASPPDFWYDQEEAEWVLVLQGEALLQLEGVDELVRLTPGLHINLPAHRKHRVAWTHPDVETVWLALFY